MIDRIGAALSRPRMALFAIVVLSIVLLGPALVDPAALTGDSYIAYRWQGHFAQAFWQGDLWPRWLPDLNFGSGSPVFFIYPPLSQWLPALLDPVLPGAEWSGSRVIAILLLARIVGGWGVLRWLEAMGVSRKGALLGAAIYLLLPYHAFMDSYQRAACAELVGMGVLPWGLRYAHAVRAGERSGWAGFAISIAALLYSHAPTALFGAPFLCLYAVAIADRSNAVRIWVTTGLAAALGVGLAAAYLGPALTQVHLINGQHLFNGIYKPTNYLFFSSVRWPDPGIEGAALICLAVHVLMLGGVMLLTRQTKPVDARARLFLLIAFAIILVLMTEVARPLWREDLPWARIQFAWRMLTLHTLILAGLGGMAWDAVAQGRQANRGRMLLLALIPALFVADAGMLGIRVWRAAQRTENWPPAYLKDYARDVNEYWVGDFEHARRFGPKRVITVDPATEVHVLQWKSRAITFVANAPAATRIIVRQWAYSGWDMRIDGSAWRPTERLPAPDNYVVVPVPAGRHRVEITMPALPAERIGAAISWASAGLLLTLLAIGLITRYRALVRNRDGSI
ncbi:hypothetical protein [Sphingomonas crocodyli]|uniref:Membrane protein 6-pyruvoyl-tetrahydropterin synthase-related domain-containing protein n=1 Tax=Sphingomonas crocodyli TaxID=1979270 RepID=A0A437M8M3_9SPHN|nr:hypothetical protein [Sphingomonas crocodyli]RVT93937.1 hypothetical protein EOD43_08775 [Sphingomonas crocodyli]